MNFILIHHSAGQEAMTPHIIPERILLLRYYNYHTTTHCASRLFFLCLFGSLRLFASRSTLCTTNFPLLAQCDLFGPPNDGSSLDVLD